jgi:Na+-driven multidrug efflux pump
LEPGAHLAGRHPGLVRECGRPALVVGAVIVFDVLNICFAWIFVFYVFDFFGFLNPGCL